MLQSIRSETVVWGLSGFYAGLGTLVAIRRSLRKDGPSGQVIATEWFKELAFTAVLLAVALWVLSKGYPRTAIALNAIPLVMAAIVAIFAVIWVSDEASAKHPVPPVPPGSPAGPVEEAPTEGAPTEEQFEIHRTPARDHQRALAPRY